jgi:hypothetical protein
LALVDEFRDIRPLARPDDLYGDGPTPEQRALLHRYIKLQDRLAQTPAMAGPGILAKLLATLPSRKTARRWCSLLRSAMLDLLEFAA